MAERNCILLASHSQAATIASLAACHCPVYLALEGEEGSGVWEVVELDSVSLMMLHPPLQSMLHSMGTGCSLMQAFFFFRRVTGHFWSLDFKVPSPSQDSYLQ